MMNKYENTQQFIKERNESMLSLDKDKILRFCKKYGLTLPSNEISFWAGIHKVILVLGEATPQQKSYSREWLLTHGFTDGINLK